MENTPRPYSELVAVVDQPDQWLAVRHLYTLAWMVVGLMPDWGTVEVRQGWKTDSLRGEGRLRL